MQPATVSEFDIVFYEVMQFLYRLVWKKVLLLLAQASLAQPGRTFSQLSNLSFSQSCRCGAEQCTLNRCSVMYPNLVLMVYQGYS